MRSIFKYKNDIKSPVTFILEPWAIEYKLLENQEIACIGQHENLESQCSLIRTDKYIIFHSWDHSLVNVYIDGIDKTTASGSVRF